MGQNSTKAVSLRGKQSPQDGVKDLGHALKADFPGDPKFRNLNNGSFGTIPKVIQEKRRHYQDLYELQPDPFIRRDLPKLIDDSRKAVAEFVNAPVEEIVFVNNATEGINTVLRNLIWNADGKDVIISFNTIYDACARAEDFLVDYFEGKVAVDEISLKYPLEDNEILQVFRDEVKKIESEGKRARLALFDIVSSNPGVLFPWKDMVVACRELGILSLVDGAQGIGMVQLDLAAVKADFLVSNLHKWLHTPRACALLYVPVENQKLISTTLGTARGYIPKQTDREGRTQPLPVDGEKSHFVRNFEWVGTRDDSAYLCAKDAIAWRCDVPGGEERILSYLWDLNQQGVRRMAEILGTEILENKAGVLMNCAMGNVALPIRVGDEGKEAAGPEDLVVSSEEAFKVFKWMETTLIDEYKTFIAVWVRWNRFWVRMSAQVFLEMDDYEWAANTLKALCERVANGEFHNS